MYHVAGKQPNNNRERVQRSMAGALDTGSSVIHASEFASSPHR